MKILTATTTILNDLLGLFYPRRCRLCDDLLVTGESQLCIRCIVGLPRVFPQAVNGVNRIGQQLTWHGPIEDAFAYLYYTKDGDVQQLVHAFKYKGKRELAFVLGKLAAQEANTSGNLLQSVNAIVPVPVTRWKKWKRGYNQTEWIARGIASVCSLPIISCLKRTGPANTQTRKSVYERRHILEAGVFTVPDPAAYAGRHLLLVDDVMTTGATLGACIDALRTIPDVRVSILVLTIV